MIDESRVLFKGSLALKQYILTIPQRFGWKLFVICDCEARIVIDIILYSGTDVDTRSHDLHRFSDSMVKTSMDPQLNKGHILNTDNYYTSLLLCACMTIRLESVGP